MSDLDGFFENAFANHAITSREFERFVFENPKDGAFYAELVTARGTLCVVGDGPDMMVRHHGHGRDVAEWVRWIASEDPNSYYLHEKILGETREWDLTQALAEAEAYSRSENGWALTPEKLEEARSDGLNDAQTPESFFHILHHAMDDYDEGIHGFGYRTAGDVHCLVAMCQAIVRELNK